MRLGLLGWLIIFSVIVNALLTVPLASLIVLLGLGFIVSLDGQCGSCDIGICDYISILEYRKVLEVIES